MATHAAIQLPGRASAARSVNMGVAVWPFALIVGWWPIENHEVSTNASLPNGVAGSLALLLSDNAVAEEMPAFGRRLRFSQPSHDPTVAKPTMQDEANTRS